MLQESLLWQRRASVQEPALLVAEAGGPVGGGDDGSVGRNEIQEIKALNRSGRISFTHIVGEVGAVGKIGYGAQHGVRVGNGLNATRDLCAFMVELETELVNQRGGALSFYLAERLMRAL